MFLVSLSSQCLTCVFCHYSGEMPLVSHANPFRRSPRPLLVEFYHDRQRTPLANGVAPHSPAILPISAQHVSRPPLCARHRRAYPASNLHQWSPAFLLAPRCLVRMQRPYLSSRRLSVADATQTATGPTR